MSGSGGGLWRAARLRIALGGMLLVHAVLLGWSATRHSPTVDEVGHMAAGISHWQLERFDLYRVNPPLVRLVAALPVVLCGPKTDWGTYSDAPGSRTEFDAGRKFISLNGEESLWYFTLARWACIPFSLLAAVVCYAWAAELFGATSGLLAAALWCFSPLVIGAAELITPDAGAAALGALASWLFWRWLKRPGWWGAVLAGLALGLALLSKTTWVILVPAWPYIWLAWRLAGAGQAWASAAPAEAAEPAPSSRPASRGWWSQLGQMIVIEALALYLLNCVYIMEGTGTPLGQLPFVSRAFSGIEDRETVRQLGGGNRFRGTFLGAIPMPVPKNFLLGIDVQKRDFEQGFRSYLRGEWRQGGWWYYYLYGLAVKLPLGTWALAGLAAGLMAARARYRAPLADELFLLWTPVAIVALVSSQTGFNHHLRYVLPAMPFLFVGVSRVARAVEFGDRNVLAFGAAAFAWSVGGLAFVYPHCLSYFNELAGGPQNGAAHLLDSNIDWGQDLVHLREWMASHPEARPMRLAYFGMMDPRAIGIEFEAAPRGPVEKADLKRPEAPDFGPQPGWYAVSITFLHGLHFSIPDGKGSFAWVGTDAFTYFQRFQPVARAGYSISIYHLELDEVNRVRQEMGLPVWPPPDEDRL